PKPVDEIPQDASFETVIVNDTETLKACIDELNKAKQIAFDTETSGLDPMISELVGISLAADPTKGYYFPVGHEEGAQLELDEVKKALLPILTNPDINKVAHNAKFDLVVLQQAGLDVTPITFDTMIAEWVVNPTSRSLGLKAQASERLGVQMTQI